MAHFTSHAPGTPCWVDMMSPDVAASTAFYTKVFGWEAEEQIHDGQHIYTLFLLNGRKTAGLGGQSPDMGEMPAAWHTYIATDDCDATAAKVTAAGGSVVMPSMAVTDAGHMAVFTDPTGAFFSVWKAGEHIGAEICNEPNCYSWSELNTRGVDKALPFYAEVFGWTYETQEMPDGAYHVIAGGESGGLGGLMDLPPEVPEMVPPHWATYFAVADTDATVALIEEAGGTIVAPSMDIPGVGRMAVAHDPLGGHFSVLQAEA